MRVLPNSRYANSTIATVQATAEFGGGDVAAIVPSAAVAYSFQYVSHQVMTGDRADSLAYQYYTDPSQWFRIAQANPEILWWDDLTPGTVIRIPVI